MYIQKSGIVKKKKKIFGSADLTSEQSFNLVDQSNLEASKFLVFWEF